MLGFIPFYPYSCNPSDIMTAVESMHERFLFGDVMCRGHYGSYIFKEWERDGTAPDMEPGDAGIWEHTTSSRKIRLAMTATGLSICRLISNR